MPSILEPPSQMVGQNRAPNTINLRNQYSQYNAMMQVNGQDPLPFEAWVQQNYPEQKILTQR